MPPLEQALIAQLKNFVAFARQRVGDPHLAEDLVQASLLKAIEAERQPETEEETVRWFYRILRRSIIDHYRRHASQDRMLERVENGWAEEPSDEDRRNLCRCFEALLPELPENQRELVRRIDLGSETVAVVAKDLGVTENNLHVRLHRARKSLRERVEQTCRVCSQHGCLDCTCEPPQQPINFR